MLGLPRVDGCVCACLSCLVFAAHELAGCFGDGCVVCACVCVRVFALFLSSVRPLFWGAGCFGDADVVCVSASRAVCVVCLLLALFCLQCAPLSGAGCFGDADVCVCFPCCACCMLVACALSKSRPFTHGWALTVQLPLCSE